MLLTLERPQADHAFAEGAAEMRPAPHELHEAEILHLLLEALLEPVVRFVAFFDCKDSHERGDARGERCCVQEKWGLD